MARRGGMSDVELEFDDVAPVVASEAPRTRRRVRWWVIGGVTLAAGLALMGTQWVIDARENAAVARVVGVPGVVAELDGRLEVVRALTPDGMYALSQAAAGVPEAPQLQVAADGSQSVRSLDPATGQERWSVPLLGPDPARAEAGSDAALGSACDAVDSFAVCLATDGFVRYAKTDLPPVVVPATSTDIVVLDASNGQVVSRWPVPRGDRLAVLPGLVVIGEVDPARGFVLTGYDLRTGRERWTRADPFTDATDAGSFWSLMTGSGVVTYQNGLALRVVSADGELVRESLEQGTNGAGLQRDQASGNLVLTTTDARGSTTSTVLGQGAAPADDWTLDGYLLTPSVDDGSVPGLTLSLDGSLHAWDRTTHRKLWEATDLSSVRSALVLRGRVFLGTDLSITAVDGRTGRTLWTSKREPGRAPTAVFTDGRHLLASFAPTAADTGADVVAYAPASGEEMWRAPLPDGVVSVQPVAGTLLGWSSDGVSAVVLGSPRTG